MKSKSYIAIMQDKRNGWYGDLNTNDENVKAYCPGLYNLMQESDDAVRETIKIINSAT